MISSRLVTTRRHREGEPRGAADHRGGVRVESPRGGLVGSTGAQAPTVALVLLGLAYRCWCCGALGTALVGLIEPGGDLLGPDLVLCDEERPLAAADELLPPETRRIWRVCVVRVGAPATSASHLSNACAKCGAVFSRWSVFNEGVAAALTTHGHDALEPLALVETTRERWITLCDRSVG